MQKLTEFALQQISPTSDQHMALLELDKFLGNDQRCFILKGYAGTGKTFLTKTIAGYLVHLNKSFIMMAPTGRAARVLTEKTGYKATTIHKAIYNLDHLDEIQLRKDGKVKYKFRYNLNRHQNNKGGVFIIDEASMISDRTSENDFFIFGSGRLLSDLIDFATLKDPDSTTKIIFIGDPAQLPPVGDPDSGALSETYLAEKFSIHSMAYELSEVVRQGAQSNILKLATQLRTLMGSSVRSIFKIEFDKDVEKVSVADITRLFLKDNPGLLYQKSVIINHSNRSALDFNLDLRQQRFSSKYQIEQGDTLMIVQNNYNYSVELLNGTMVKVVEVATDPEIKAGMLSYNPNGDECRITCRFRRIVIEVSRSDNEPENLDCLILEDFLYSPDPSPDYSQNVALYLDFKIRNPHLIPKSKPFADALRKDRYFNALKVKYGYAVTCHKAQGGEWDDVFLNLDVGIGVNTDPFLRWVYTAVTRASKKLYLFNVPVKHQFSNFRYAHTLLPPEKQSSGTTQSVIISDTGAFDELVVKLAIRDIPRFRYDKFFEIWALTVNEQVTVNRYNQETWCDIYGFVSEGKAAGLKFWFNGKNQFTRIEQFVPWTTSAEFALTLIKLYSKPANIQVIEQPSVDEAIVPAVIQDLLSDENPEAEQKFFDTGIMAPLRVLYTELREGLSGNHITISRIEHQNYCEIYYFKRDSEKAMVQFYYNKEYAFTTSMPILSNCNSNRLLEDLSGIINQIRKRSDD